MTEAEFNAFCARLPATTFVEQWGGAQVWKVGGKVFAIGFPRSGALAVTFKVSEIGFAMLRDRPGLRPAPYLAARGLTWIQRTDDSTLDDAALCDHLRAAHGLIARGLAKKTRARLGLIAD